MDAQSITTLVTNVGLAGGLAVFFVLQGTKREDKFNARISSLETFQKETLLRLVERNAELLGRNQDVLERCISAMDKWERHLDRIETLTKGNGQ